MKRSRSQGFTILEVMVTVIILALGMLGLGALILRGQQSTREAYDRVAALYYLQFMTERIRANAMPVRAPRAPIADAVAPAYATMATTADGLPGSGQLARAGANGTAPANDLYAWDQLLAGVNKQQSSGGTTLNLGGIEQAFGCITLVSPAAGLAFSAVTNATPYFLFQSPGWINAPDNPTAAGLAYSWNVEVVWLGGASRTVNPAPSACAMIAFAGNAAAAKSVSSVVTIYR